MARIIPQLSARDVDAYVTFLGDAFGFRVKDYWRDPGDPAHVNVEVELDGAVIGVGRASAERSVAQNKPDAGIGLYVIVDDVDAHFERAVAAGATITSPLEEQPWGHKMYGAVDPEGHEWGFATPASGKE